MRFIPISAYVLYNLRILASSSVHCIAHIASRISPRRKGDGEMWGMASAAGARMRSPVTSDVSPTRRPVVDSLFMRVLSTASPLFNTHLPSFLFCRRPFFHFISPAAFPFLVFLPPLFLSFSFLPPAFHSPLVDSTISIFLLIRLLLFENIRESFVPCRLCNNLHCILCSSHPLVRITEA